MIREPTAGDALDAAGIRTAATAPAADNAPSDLDVESPKRGGTQEAPELSIPEIRVGPNGMTFGRMPALPPEKAYERGPDFIAVLNRDGTQIAGYVKKTDLMPRATPDGPIGLAESNMTVYAEDGETVTGTWYMSKGFVAVGEDPRSIPDDEDHVAIETP